jgi:hypothetical protein
MVVFRLAWIPEDVNRAGSSQKMILLAKSQRATLRGHAPSGVQTA